LDAHYQRKIRLRREWLLTAAVAAALLAVLVFANVARPLGNVIYDHFMRWHGFRATQDIVIVAIDDRSLSELGGWPLKRSAYTALMDALSEGGNRPKALGVDLLFLDPTPDDANLAQSLRPLAAVLPLEFKIQDDANQTYWPSPPVAPLGSAAELGHINLSFDSDGVIRGFKAIDHQWPHFALAMQALGTGSQLPTAAPEMQRFRMVDPRVGFPMVSLVDALQSEATQALLKDKYVLIGVTAPSLSDRYPTLYSGKNNASTPGVAILASILNASLQNALIQEAPSWVVLLCAGLALAVLLQSLVLIRPRQSLLLALLLIGASLVCSYGLLAMGNVWVDPIPFILVTLIIQPLWAWRRLEAIVHVVEGKAADLQPLHTARLGAGQQHRSREVVLQYGKLLDRAVASARSELDFLSTIVDEMPNAVAIFDTHEALVLCNRQLKGLLASTHLPVGTPLADVASVLGLPMSAMSPTQPPSGDMPLAVFALATPQGTQEFYVKNTVVPSPVGGTLHLVILMDITELRQSQIQRDRALQFLSHDMRTPVASIMSITQQEQLSKSERDKIRHHGRALLHMMDDFILTISAEANKYKLQEQLLDNLLNDAIEQVSDLAHAKGIDICDESEPNSIFIMANARLLVRALVNLLFNAVKFSPAHSTIRVAIRGVQADMVHIDISNPVEMGEDAHDLIPSMPGFGLGLDFVDMVIHKHNGTLLRNIPASTGMAYVQIALPCVVHV
jgi:CHASE2 domain-containing sensor protein/signal transduction histidine kinase